MRIAVWSNDSQWEELNNRINEVDYLRMKSFSTIPGDIAAYMFLEENKKWDLQITTKPILINAVCDTLKDINAPANVARINGWNSFLSRPCWEIAGAVNESLTQVFSALGKQLIEVPDEPGFVSARIIAMIINEAYFALEENVSTKEEIDVAMKLGTNYPYGPFEWANIIGVHNILALLQKMKVQDDRYMAAPLLGEETNS